jgi:hypothetical protein
MAAMEMWAYREQGWTTGNLVGLKVEALDGSIGKIDEASYDVGAGYLVVDTGPWIFGNKVMLPAGVVDRVDFDEEQVYVNRTKDEIKNAPEFDPDRYRDDAYRGQLGSYYGPGGAGWRDYEPS